MAKKLVIIQISEYNRIYDWRNTMNYLTTIEMSKMGNYLETDSNFMRARSNRWRCEKGKTWLIPCDAEKPEDARKNNHSKRGVLVC